MKNELRELVRKTIEETINAMLDEEADQLVGAVPYERTDGRAAYRAGHYERGFTTTTDQVTLRMPKLKRMRFATAVIERYKRRETSVEEVIIEMYLAGCLLGASRTSARSCGARAFPPARSPTCLCQAGNEQSGTRNLSSLADGLVKRSPFRASAPHPCGGSIPRTR